MAARDPKRHLGITLLLLCTLALCGCVWSRLYETKQQLADFDHYFKVQASDRFLLQFLQPKLFSDDFIYLSGLKPAEERILPWGKRWSHRFRKLGPNGELAKPAVEMVFEMTFDSTSRLMAWDFSPEFVAMAPPEFLELSFRSLGQARIFEAAKQLKADLSQLPKSRAPLPRRANIVKILGEPAEKTQKQELPVYVYRFKADGEAVNPSDPDLEKRRIATAKLTFDPHTDQLIKLSSNFVGLKFAIDYRKLSATP